MKFDDTKVLREERFSLGIERESGRFYLSIPVSNGLVDYEEYYALDRAAYERYSADPRSAIDFVQRCRERKEDALLIVQPGSNRGTAI